MRREAGTALGALAVLVSGCLRDAPLDGARCPCVDGYVCCATTQACLRPSEVCPGPTPDAAPETAGSPTPDAAPEAAASPVPDAAPAPDASLAPMPDASVAAMPDASGLALVGFEPAEGPVAGGTAVLVTGAGFTPDSTVRFGAHRAAAVEYLDAGRLRVVTPPGAVDVPAVPVLVEDDGHRAVARADFRYVLPTMVEVTETAGLRGGRGVGVVVDDVDADGHRDLVVARSSPELPAIWRAGPDLRFAAGPEGEGLAGLPYFEDVVPVDLDARPPLELVALRTWLPPRETLYVLGGPTHAAERRLPEALDAVSSWDALVAFDVDGDGDIDLAGVRGAPLFAEGTTTVGSLLRADGGRLTAEPGAFELGPGLRSDAETFGLASADLDADGFVDLVLVLDGTPRLYRGGPGGPSFVADAFDVPPEGGLSAPHVADLDADGVLEVVFLARARLPEAWFSTGVFVYRASGGRYERAAAEPWPGAPLPCPDAIHPEATLGAGFGGVATGDVDLDGDLDLLLPAVTDRCPVEPLWVESGRVDDGTAWRAAHRMGDDAARRFTGLLPDDLDGDGDLDLVAHAWLDGERTRLYRNNIRENRGTSAGSADGYLLLDVRNRQGYVPFGARVEVDLDGPADAPDFAPGPGRLAVRVVGGGGTAGHGDGRVQVGLGPATGPFHARVRLPDGPLSVRIDGSDRLVPLGP